MKVLFLSQVVPYPMDAGPKVRSYHVLQYLASIGHDITLVTFSRTSDRSEALEHLQRLCSTVHTVPMRRSRVRDGCHLLRSLLVRQPFLVARDWVPEMARLIDRLTGQVPFDVIHADQLWMAPYALHARARCQDRWGRSPLAILDQHNAVFQIPQRLANGTGNPLKRSLLALEARKMVYYELATCCRFDRVVWVTQDDYTALAGRNLTSGARPVLDDAWAAPQRSTVIPICVDPVSKPVIARAAEPQRVTFLGGLHWPPNAEGILSFYHEVWPQVQQQVPDARLTVIGKDPPPALAHAAGRASGLDVTGYVADPTPYLAETAAFIVPLYAGGGMRVKILDAWAWGLPVVSTSVGAEGLQARNGENVLLADRPADLACAVIRLLRDPQLAARLAAGGRETLLRCYDWRTVYRDWDRVYGCDQESSYHVSS